MPSNDKLNYISTWDIDQILYQGQITATLTGTFTPVNVLLYSYTSSFPLVVDGTFQTTGDTVWRQFGDSTTSLGINLETFLATTSSGVYLTYYNFGADITVNVRYYVWTDKVTY